MHIALIMVCINYWFYHPGVLDGKCRKMHPTKEHADISETTLEMSLKKIESENYQLTKK